MTINHDNLNNDDAPSTGWTWALVGILLAMALCLAL